jgi:predicted RNA binding protein YcfA (HicA-like mRNA interferase family)
MPRKIRELIADLTAASFIDRGGKGSHRNFTKGRTRCTISGKAGEDAAPYQEKQVRARIAEAGGKP